MGYNTYWRTANHVIQHLTEAFAIMGFPVIIKRDDGLAYTFYTFKKLCVF